MSTETDARRQVLNEVGSALRRLTANLIDIVRGAGKPLELGRDVDAFTAALDGFERVVGEHPKAWELADMLRVPLEPEDHPTSEEEMAERYAHHAILQRSLLLAVARLLGQEAEAAAAYDGLHEALSGLELTKQKIEKRARDREEPVATQMRAKTNTRHD
jgi:hypothetical protein